MRQFKVGDRVIIIKDLGGDTPEAVLKSGVIDCIDYENWDDPDYCITLREYRYLDLCFCVEELQLIEGVDDIEPLSC